MPVDDCFFQNLNSAQAIWYHTQIAEDEKDDFELLRYMEEYNAMFTNPDGVQRIREARENTVGVPDEQFNKTVKELFGRDMPDSTDKDDVKNMLIKDNNNKNKMSQYVELELDEVRFIPYGA